MYAPPNSSSGLAKVIWKILLQYKVLNIYKQAECAKVLKAFLKCFI